MDIADLRRARKYIPNPNVALIQGSVLHYPFRPSSFDHAYSTGVLHHTRSTREAFDKTAPLVKPGGRLHVWLYSPEPLLMNLKRKTLRAFILRLNINQQKWLLNHILIPTFKAKTLLLRRKVVHDKHWHEEQQMRFFDGIAVPYDHKQTPKQAEQWFKEAGYEVTHLSNIEESGFGMTGKRT